MSSVSSSDSLVDDYEESRSNSIVHKDDCAEKMSDEKKNSSEISCSCFLDNCSSDSDSVNSSDLDEDEINDEWNRLSNSQQRVETEFNSLKNLLFNEKMREVDLQLAEVKSGNLKNFEAAQVLQNKMKSRLEIASILKELKFGTVEHKTEARAQETMQSLENDKEILYDTIKADLKEQIEKLEEARYEAEVDSALYLSRNPTIGRGGRHPYGHVEPKQKKPVFTSQPCIVYMLKDEEIIEDCMLIRKSIRLSALNRHYSTTDNMMKNCSK